MRATNIANRLSTRVVFALAAVAQSATTAVAQSNTERRASIAVEADAIAYGIAGYSGIVSISFANGFQMALGSGRYEVPSFLLSSNAKYEAAKWKATSTSVQVLRAMYRLNGPMKSGLALGGVILNQNWRLKSETLGGETKFGPLSAGVTAVVALLRSDFPWDRVPIVEAAHSRGLHVSSQRPRL